MSSGLDAKFSGEIFRKNQPLIIATNRHHAMILPGRLAYDSSQYLAGQVLARNTVSGLFQKYVDGSSSGVGTAAGVLLHDVEAASGVNELAQVCFKGELYKSKLIGLDSAGEVDLGARTVVDASSTEILVF